jgi:valyl-tRNA synthetase
MKRIGRRIGLSCDFDAGYETDSPAYRAFSQAQFLRLFDTGFVVEELRPNSFDTKLGTTIADAEVFYEERRTRLNHVTWQARDPRAATDAADGLDPRAATDAADARSADGTPRSEAITISTTRPELICACRAVLVHPDHGPTKHLIGRLAVLPIARGTGADGQPLSVEVPILAHPHVKTEFGSGIMMVCSYGDQADVQLFRELELQPIAAIGMDGRMTAAAGAYEGLKVEEARARITSDLEAAGLLPRHDVVEQAFPVSERSKAPVEVISLKEWYVKQTHCTDDLRRHARDMAFVPDKHRQLLLDWIDTVSIDWPISRRRWYHTEIPLWLVLDGDENEAPYLVVPPAADVAHGASDTKRETKRVTGRETKRETQRDMPSGVAPIAAQPYYRPWAEGPPAGSRVVHRETRAALGPLDAFLAANPTLHVVGEQKVFDTWMDSSVSHLYVLKDHADRPWHAGHTCSLRANGRDIVRTWLYYATLKQHLLHGTQPFSTCVVHGMGMDRHGRKMSKSVGNVIDPDEIIDKFGSDAFRLWIAGECTIGDDFRIDPEKIQGAGKFLQKLANVVNFVARFEAPAERPVVLHPVDEWILGELDAVTADAVAGYDAIDLFTPANKVRSFVWNVFAPHYLELVKGRAYGDEAAGVAPDAAACWTLHEVVRRVLALLAPLAPFITHHLATAAYGLDVHAASLPAPLGFAHQAPRTEAILAFNSAVWKHKQDAGLSLAAPIAGVDVPADLADLADVLTAMHRLGAQVEA